MATSVMVWLVDSSSMGKADAQAWVLFVILMIFTAIAFWSQKHWVYYQDEGR